MMDTVFVSVAIMAIRYQRFGTFSEHWFTRQYSHRGRVMAALIPVSVVLVCLAIAVGVGVTRAAASRHSYTGKVNPVVAHETTVWKTGDANIFAYRIPLLISTPKGYLIAAAEARPTSISDTGPKYLTIRRSTDKGLTWGPQRFILNNGSIVKDGFALGSILVDRNTSMIIIMYLQCGPPGAHPKFNVGCHQPAVTLINSTDDGATWGKPRSLTEQIGHVTFAAGPGYGIQKQREPFKGRLIFCGHRSHSGTFCILSDDHGLTWRYGQHGMFALPYHQPRKLGDFQPSECHLVELPNGSIMLNARNGQKYRCKCRIVATSTDGAETFPMENIRLDETLIDPSVSASLLFHNSVLFFTNPKNTASRVNLTLQWSFSNGNKWDGEYVIWRKLSAYSTMTSLPNDQDYIYILFEKGTHRAYESISLVKVKLKR